MACVILALAGQPLEPSLYQEVQASGEVIAAEKLAFIDFTRGEILDLCDLFDETVTRDYGTSGSSLTLRALV
jgi:hypothetical protein